MKTNTFLICIFMLYGFTAHNVENVLVKVENKNIYDDSFLIKNRIDLLDFILSKQIESKINCYSLSDYDKYIQKLELFAPLDSFFDLKNKKVKIGRYYFLKTYLGNKKLNKKLKKQLEMRVEYFLNRTGSPCYYFNSELKELNGSQFFFKRSLRVDSLINNYFFIYINRHKGSFSNWRINKNSLRNEYNCYMEEPIDGHPYYDDCIIMAYSKSKDKPHLILGEEFCQAKQDWKTLFSKLTIPKVLNDTVFRNEVFDFYIRLYANEYFGISNFKVKTNNLQVNLESQMATVILKDVIFKSNLRGEYNKQDILVKLNTSTGDIEFSKNQ